MKNRLQWMIWVALSLCLAGCLLGDDQDTPVSSTLRILNCTGCGAKHERCCGALNCYPGIYTRCGSGLVCEYDGPTDETGLCRERK
jgi:hypothetical protein